MSQVTRDQLRAVALEAVAAADLDAITGSAIMQLGALSLGGLAADFVLQPEMWPVFAAWLRERPGATAEGDWWLDNAAHLPMLVRFLDEMVERTERITARLG